MGWHKTGSRKYRKAGNLLCVSLTFLHQRLQNLEEPTLIFVDKQRLVT